MKIEKYEFTKKNNYNIYLSNGEVITLNERVITKNELLLKKEIDKELYSKLMHDNNVCEAFDAGVKYIAIRLRSIKEMRDYLFKKGYLVDVVNEAIQNLINNDYLDDDRFTKAYIKDKMAFTSKGDYKIRMELSNLGIDNGIIDNNILMIDNDMLFNKMKKIIDKDIKNPVLPPSSATVTMAVKSTSSKRFIPFNMLERPVPPPITTIFFILRQLQYHGAI